MHKIPIKLSVEEVHRILDELSVGLFEEYIEDFGIQDIEPEPIAVITIKTLEKSG